MSEEKRKSGGEATEDITGKAAKLGRREVLTAIGVVGTALATGTAVSLLSWKSYAETVSQSVYGDDCCCENEPVHMTDSAPNVNGTA
ncbi:MAG: hypothetical protein K0R28_5549 [Paenibacillus sp.]|jgi:hypothetical protein|nr:hypothetical protein [Paenibacillus sp.]